MAVEIATAYVSLTASARGIGQQIAQQVGAPAAAAGSSAGSGFMSKFGAAAAAGSKIAIGAVAGVGAAVAGVGVGLFQLGSTFDDAYDRIRVGTGATGEAFDGLKESFRGVLSSVPGDAESAAAAIDTLNTKLGLTGAPLEVMSQQMLELSRITETDVQANLDAAAGVINNWGVSVSDQSPAMDMLFRVTQATGVGFADLSTELSQNGAALRAVGFDLNDAAALLGGLSKAGVSATDVMPAFQRAMASAAEAGMTAEEALSQTWDAIASAPNEVAAAQAAVETFGTRAGPRLAAMIREGQLSFEDLADSVRGGGDTILGVGEETQDFAEKWQVMSNRVKVALEPLATRVFDAVGNAVERLAPVLERGIAWFTSMVDIFEAEGLGGVVNRLSATFRGLWPSIRAWLADMLGKLVAWVQEMAPVVGAQLVAWGSALVEWILPQIPPMLEKLGQFASAAGQWILEEGLPLLVRKLREWGAAFIAWVGPQIGPLLGELWKLGIRLGVWVVTEALPYVQGKLMEWAWAFLGWVADAAAQLPGKLWELARSLGRWMLDEGLPYIRDKLAQWAAAFLVWAQDTARDIPGWIASGLSAVAQEMLDIGVSIVEGIWNGISSMAGWLADKVTGFITDNIPGPIRDLLGIFSPSRAMADLGQEIPRGLALGISQTAPVVSKEMELLAGMVMGALATRLMRMGVDPRNPAVLANMTQTAHAILGGQQLGTLFEDGSAHFRSPGPAGRSMAGYRGGSPAAAAGGSPLRVEVPVYLDKRLVGRGVSTAIRADERSRL